MPQGFPPLNPIGNPGRGNTLVLRNTVSFSDDGSAVTLGTLPAGAVILSAWINVTTAFDDTGTDLVDIGVDGDTDAFCTDEDVSSTGVVVCTMDGTGRYLSAEDVVVAQYDGANGDSTAGECEVIVSYVVADA